MSGTAQTYITQAFLNLNVFQPGATIPTALLNDALTRLNGMMSTWAHQLTAPAAYGVGPYPLTAGKNTYLWGTNGTPDIPFPRPQRVIAATLVLPNTNPPVEVPLAVLTDEMWANIKVKSLQSTQPTAVYYVQFASYPPSGNAALLFWPVPNNSLYQFNVYAYMGLSLFPDLNTTTLQLPLGYDEAIIYNLEARLAGPYGREMPAADATLARETFANIMRANLRLSDLPNDFALAFGPAHRAGYNIQSGSGGGT